MQNTASTVQWHKVLQYFFGILWSVVFQASIHLLLATLLPLLGNLLTQLAERHLSRLEGLTSRLEGKQHER